MQPSPEGPMTQSQMSLPSPDADSVRDELRRQYRLLRDEMVIRLVTTVLAYALSAIFLDWPVIVACAAVNLVAETTNLILLRDMDPEKDSGSYRVTLVMGFLIQFAYVIPPALIWHNDTEYAKAFAIGMVLSRLLHLVSVVSTHLPLGMAGFIAVSVVVMSSSTVYWLRMMDIPGLVIGSICALAVLFYCLSAMLACNRLHRETAAGQREALAANAAKGRFLAMMSHELRTPLNAILGMGHAERQRSTDAIGRERLGVLITSAESLGTILDDILDMSAIQQGKMPIRPRPTQLRDEVSMVIDLFRPRADETKVRITMDLAPDVPRRALTDPQRLRQCLSNLLSNALKHTERGEVRVEARMAPRVQAAPLLRIEVSDSGRGVPQDWAETIFIPFARGPGVGLGNGLGLSISRALARQMGGDLRLLPQHPGEQGARFVLTIEIETLPDLPPASPAESCGTASLAGRVVLAVDDLATNRLVALTYLRLLGAVAIEAASGDEALATLQREKVDLVLLDMNMPAMDGLTTLRHLRALPSPLASVPVVAMTADALAEHRQRYMAAGLDGYLTKPMSPEQIEAELLRVLEASSPQPVTG